MQIFPETQGVILTEKHLSFPDNFVQSSKKLPVRRNYEIFAF